MTRTSTVGSIVGVAGDVRYRGRDLEPVSQAFVLFQQNPYGWLPYAQSPNVSFVVRVTADPATLIKAVQSRIWSVDKDQPILAIQTMEQTLSQSGASRRVYLLLMGVLAVIAVLMATSGIYGLVSFSVTRRTQEMGIHFALGATPARVLTLVMRKGMISITLGVCIGLGGSLAFGKRDFGAPVRNPSN